MVLMLVLALMLSGCSQPASSSQEEQAEEEENDDDEGGEPHGYVSEMEESLTMEPLEPVSKDELQDVFDEEPKVKVGVDVAVSQTLASCPR